MQLIIAAIIIGTVAIFIGKALLRFARLEIKRRSSESQLRKAAVAVLEADNRPTKIERATAEAQAKVKLKHAISNFDRAVAQFVEVEG